jgi:hypothetical protein
MSKHALIGAVPAQDASNFLATARNGSSMAGSQAAPVALGSAPLLGTASPREAAFGYEVAPRLDGRSEDARLPAHRPDGSRFSEGGR